MTTLFCNWQEVRAAGSAAVGGKAWTLAHLAGYGFPIPAGMVIPVTAYRAWLTETGQESRLLAATRLDDSQRSAALEEIHGRLLAAAPGEEVCQALREELAKPAWSGVPLAVRSSSPQEDSASASFAGIHHSCLNVCGEVALLEAMACVWASLWSPAAVAYREHLGIPHEDVAMAVLIMPFIPAQSSGIGFTCDPVSGRDDRLVIHANWGLGESLVGGHTAGDEIVLGENVLDDSLFLTEYKAGGKTVTSIPRAGGGTVLAAASPAEASACVLGIEQALALGELLRQAALALHFAGPAYDCEWAWDGEAFHLLQARPITVRGRCTYPELDGQPEIWSRGNTRDVVPMPLSPMDWGASRRLVNFLLEEGYRLSGFPLQAGAQRAGLFHGRLYLNLSLIQWEGYAAFAVEPQAMNRLVGGHQPEILVPPLTWRRRLARALGMGRFLLKAGAMRRRGNQEVMEAMATTRRWLAEELPEDDAGFAAELRRQMRHGRSRRGLHFMQGSGGASLSLAVALIDSHLPGEGHALASALLAGGPPSVTARQSYDLIGVARIAMADPTARSWLEKRRQEGGDWRQLPADNPFRLAFADFLERYGHRGVYETYMRNQRWREDPDYLLDSLSGLAATDLDTLAARQKESVAAATIRVRQALPWWKLAMLRRLLHSAKVETNGREAARSALMAYAEPCRRLSLALGERWKMRGWLMETDDIFLLLPCEILAILDGQRPGALLLPLIADRRSKFAAWQQEEAPDVIIEDRTSTSAPCLVGADDLPVYGTVVFRGVPVGSGTSTGPARLLHSPTEGKRLQQGDILVVASTDPSWTPLFLKAGGLVMETGGFLSHGAIVAREFGIPAVVNLPGIMARLKEDDPLHIDSRLGRVSILSR